MRPADLEPLLRRVIREELRVLLDRLQAPQLPPGQAEVVRLLGAVFGGEPFTTRDLIQRLDVTVGQRPQLRTALVTMVGADLASNKVGLLLRGIAAAGGRAGALRLVATVTEGGARVWGVEGTSGD